ncbi:hypothetical protein B0T14DRAFT_338652 [Immersiella caudata]|uniref:Uncharacterized protein n=1 Tax=Immersiella caudata TaxID=314043 RepID=A0AA39WBB3_9PEZI|nr:hypothetical protein B0T14DRAFT_338652 [Immersiella caudata]
MHCAAPLYFVAYPVSCDVGDEDSSGIATWQLGPKARIPGPGVRRAGSRRVATNPNWSDETIMIGDVFRRLGDERNDDQLLQARNVSINLRLVQSPSNARILKIAMVLRHTGTGTGLGSGSDKFEGVWGRGAGGRTTPHMPLFPHSDISKTVGSGDCGVGRSLAPPTGLNSTRSQSRPQGRQEAGQEQRKANTQATTAYPTSADSAEYEQEQTMDDQTALRDAKPPDLDVWIGFTSASGAAPSACLSTKYRIHMLNCTRDTWVAVFRSGSTVILFQRPNRRSETRSQAKPILHHFLGSQSKVITSAVTTSRRANTVARSDAAQVWSRPNWGWQASRKALKWT